MPLQVVAQVHLLARRAKAKENITFTNTRDEYLYVLYATNKRDTDDVDLTQTNDKLTGMGGENKDN